MSMERLRGDLAELAVPVRTAALVTGKAASAYGPVDAAVVRWARVRVRSIASGLRAGEKEASYRTDAEGLTGLGPGLTPTGDDLLVGLAAMASRLSVSRVVAPGAAAAFARVLSGLGAGRTTPAAGRLLAQASEGLYPSVLADVVEALGNDRISPLSLDRAVSLLARTGAHSGADLLAGALTLARAVALSEEPG
jgi:hypothetical protein